MKEYSKCNTSERILNNSALQIIQVGHSRFIKTAHFKRILQFQGLLKHDARQKDTWNLWFILISHKKKKDSNTHTLLDMTDWLFLIITNWLIIGRRRGYSCTFYILICRKPYLIYFIGLKNNN